MICKITTSLIEPIETTELEEATGTAEATVHTVPSVSEAMPEQVVEEQEPVTFMSKVSQDGQPVTWYKDGHELKDGDDGCIISSDGVTSTLTLPKSEVADSSEYTVKSGDIETPAELAVAGKQLIHLKEAVILLIGLLYIELNSCRHAFW